VCSDMSVFHGVRDIYTLDSQTFFRLAYRLLDYEGATLASVESAVGEYQERIASGRTHDAPPGKSPTETPASPEPRTMTLEELRIAYPAAPSIGEEVPMFEVVRAT
jgi:hypothetical protein